jgi:hypothetical protein
MRDNRVFRQACIFHRVFDAPGYQQFTRVCAVRNPRLFAAIPLQNENHSILNGSFRMPLLPIERCDINRDQMTSGPKTGMEGVAEETGIAPALI